MERQSNALLQVAKQIQVLLGSSSSRTLRDSMGDHRIYANQSDIDVLKRAMGTMQHHDAVTGTEKQHVAEDYAERMR